jgi:hypothetical protein
MKNAVFWDVGGTPVHTRSTRRHIPEDAILHSHRRLVYKRIVSDDTN